MSDPIAAVIVAAGRGLRAGGDVPKQYRPLFGGTALRKSLALMAEHEAITLVQPVIHPGDRDFYEQSSAALDVLPPVNGGGTRQASVRAGLDALMGHKPAIVLIHDAARPFASRALVTRAIAAAEQALAAVPVLPLADTVKTVDEAGRVTGTLDRARLRVVQTPQAFDFAALYEAHARAKTAGREDFTDDAALAEWAGITVSTFEGEAANVKLTTPGGFCARRARRACLARRCPHRVRHRRSPVLRRRSYLARRRAHCAPARGHRSL